MSDRACARLATDVIYFDQQACSSPQVLYVKGQPGTSEFDGFVSRFESAFAAQSKAIGRHSLDHSETYQIQLDRAARAALWRRNYGATTRRPGRLPWLSGRSPGSTARIASCRLFLSTNCHQSLLKYRNRFRRPSCS